MRLVDQSRIQWNGRGHFFGAAANAMRRILVDQARRRLADKRGGGAVHEELDMAVSLSVEPDLDILALNEALEDLQATDDGLARVVELRYFAGLTLDETADVLGVSPQSVSRDWTVARAWLSRRLQQGAASGGPA
jgi:RNA polymerase sigma factor (TIGR02999 family)